jgi:hypothetical protein
MKKYLLTVLLMFDELINALFGGYADETISFRLALSNSKGGIPGCIFCTLIQIVWPNHCDLTKPPKASSLVRDPTLPASQEGV